MLTAVTLRAVVVDGETRVAVVGGERPGLYFWWDAFDARVRWSSPANDRPYALRTIVHHLEISADGDAAYSLLERLGIDPRAAGAWQVLLTLAAD